MIDANVISQKIISGLACPKCGHAVPAAIATECASSDADGGFRVIIVCPGCHADILNIEVDVTVNDDDEDC